MWALGGGLNEGHSFRDASGPPSVRLMMLKTFGARLSAQICLLALLAAAAVGAVHGAEGGGSVRPPPVVLLHLSDLHFSVNTHGERNWWTQTQAFVPVEQA